MFSSLHTMMLDTLYYGVWGLGFVLVFILLLLPVLFVFSMIPQMVFSSFYAKVYKRVGFMPEFTFTILTGLWTFIIVENTLNAIPACQSPLDGVVYYVYQVNNEEAAVFADGKLSKSLATIPARSLIYSPLPPTDSVTKVIPIMLVLTPPKTGNKTLPLAGHLKRDSIDYPSYYRHYDSFLDMPCQASIFTDTKQLWAWWLAF